MKNEHECGYWGMAVLGMGTIAAICFLLIFAGVLVIAWRALFG